MLTNGLLVHSQLDVFKGIPPARLLTGDLGFDRNLVVVVLPFPSQPVLWHHVKKAHAPLFLIHEEVRYVSDYVVPP